MTEMDTAKYQQLVELGQVSIFRVQKCEVQECQATMPQGLNKRWCSEKHQAQALALLVKIMGPT